MKKHTMTFGSMLLMAAFILVISGCKKDTSTTLTKAEMLQGKWQVVSFAIAGADQLHSSESGTFQCNDGTILPYTSSTSYNPYYWNFTSDLNWNLQYHLSEHYIDIPNSISNCSATYIDHAIDGDEAGTWEFNYNQSQIKILVNGILDKWNIVSITNTNMHLVLDGGDSHQMYLEKR
jgi:hypothetical protein